MTRNLRGFCSFLLVFFYFVFNLNVDGLLHKNGPFLDVIIQSFDIRQDIRQTNMVSAIPDLPAYLLSLLRVTYKGGGAG